MSIVTLADDIDALIAAPLMPIPFTLDELLAEWHGDDHSCGYHHAELVVKACDLEQPSTDIQACALFYPGVHVDEVDDLDRRIIGDGFRLWMARMDLPRRKGRVRNVLGR